MNIFDRIQHKRGLENYCTDILVGILEKDAELLRKFCVDEKVLNISENSIPNDGSLKISTQIYYKGINDEKEKSVVDIVIKGTNFLCFLEMKVESKQSGGQLPKYDSVLRTFKDKIFLRFCTKYNEIVKFEENDYFKKLRWYNIYSFLKNFNSNHSDTLINEFLDFLTLNNMDNKSVVYEEKTALSFYENFIAFDQILKNVKKENPHILNNYFSSKINPELYFEFKRYGLFLKYQDLEEHKNLWTAIFVGFEFRKGGIYKLIWLWSKNISESNFNKYDFKEPSKNREKINGLKVEERIENSNYLVSDIEKWFIEELHNIQQYN